MSAVRVHQRRWSLPSYARKPRLVADDRFRHARWGVPRERNGDKGIARIEPDRTQPRTIGIAQEQASRQDPPARSQRTTRRSADAVAARYCSGAKQSSPTAATRRP